MWTTTTTGLRQVLNNNYVSSTKFLKIESTSLSVKCIIPFGKVRLKKQKKKKKETRVTTRTATFFGKVTRRAVTKYLHYLCYHSRPIKINARTPTRRIFFRFLFNTSRCIETCILSSCFFSFFFRSSIYIRV